MTTVMTRVLNKPSSITRVIDFGEQPGIIISVDNYRYSNYYYTINYQIKLKKSPKVQII